MNHHHEGEANCLKDEHRRSEQEPAHHGHVGIEDDHEDDGGHVDDDIRKTQDVKPFRPKTEDADTNKAIVEITPEVQDLKVFYFLDGLNVVRFEEFNVGDNGNKKKQKVQGVANNKRNRSVNIKIGI